MKRAGRREQQQEEGEEESSAGAAHLGAGLARHCLAGGSGRVVGSAARSMGFGSGGGGGGGGRQ